jgi:hypothetical protein
MQLPGIAQGWPANARRQPDRFIIVTIFCIHCTFSRKQRRSSEFRLVILFRPWDERPANQPRETRHEFDSARQQTRGRTAFCAGA